MDAEQISAALERGTAAQALPAWALSLVRDVASGARELRAIRHPLGFLCLPAQRLPGHGACVHLWTPAVRPQLTTTGMHAHSWDLTSYVLYGTLRNLRIRVAEASGAATHQVFEVRSRGDVDELHATGRAVACLPAAEDVQAGGSVYGLPAGEFHATVAEAGQDVATVALSRDRPQAADLALGPLDGRSHTVARRRCGPGETARAARRIADRLAALRA